MYHNIRNVYFSIQIPLTPLFTKFWNKNKTSTNDKWTWVFSGFLILYCLVYLEDTSILAFSCLNYLWVFLARSKNQIFQAEEQKHINAFVVWHIKSIIDRSTFPLVSIIPFRLVSVGGMCNTVKGEV